MTADHPVPAVSAGARDRLAAVDTAYSDAQHDLTTVLSQPGLFDSANPATVRFLDEREQAHQLVDHDPQSWTALQSVADLEAAWQFVRAESRRVGLSGFTWRQRQRIRRGRRLLERARGDRGSPRMRVRDYFRGLQLLDGLIEVPEPLRREIHEAASHRQPLRTPTPDFPTWW